MQDSYHRIIQEWVDEWIIQENFCPFARPARKLDTINITLCHSDNWQSIYEFLANECDALLANSRYSTSLVVLSRACSDFFEYLSLLDGAQAMLEKQSWLGVFQLASFHPDYVFAGESPDSVSHYTNRSPLPIIHILQESEVSKVIASQQQADDIVARNIAHLKRLGKTQADDKLRQWCKRISKINSD